MVSQNVVHIHEFSRELIDVSQKDGRYVSGGFGKEVGASDVPVPEKIQQAVNQGDFRINDNYPPQDGEYALIAREINEYSVLAVATREVDNRGKRPLVAYRYFWLEKPAQDIDGVGTLLLWWFNTGKPRFEFQASESSSKLNSKANYCTREDFDGYFKQCSSQVVKTLSQIKHYPYVFKPESSREFLPWILHTLALQLQKQYDTTLSWAWNVRLLDRPERFTLIYCADEKAYQDNINNIKTRLKPLIPLTPSPTEIENILDALTGNGNNVFPPSQSSNVDRVLEQEQISSQLISTVDNKVWHNIKKLLLDITRNVEIDEQKLSRLAGYLDKYPSANWDWDDIVDKTMMSNSANYAKIKYWALLTILGHKTVPEWLTWLQQDNDRKSLNASLALQKRLITITVKLNQNSAYNQLVNYVYAGIIELLFKCHSLNISCSMEEEQYRAIEWLLVKSNSIWVRAFDNYAIHLVHLLIREEQVENDSFYNKIVETLKEREDLKQNRKLIKYFPEYRSLAHLFAQLKNYGLSAFFYQLSYGIVSAKIYDKDYIKIIPTIRKEPEERNLLSSVPNFFSTEDVAVHIIIILLLISLIPAAFLVANKRNFFDKIPLPETILPREKN